MYCKETEQKIENILAILNSDKPLSAVTFEFEYDKNMIEFRSAKTDDNSKTSLTSSPVSSNISLFTVSTSVSLSSTPPDIACHIFIFFL